MKKKRALLLPFVSLFLALICVLLLVGTVGFKREGPSTSSVTNVKHVQIRVDGGSWENITLPHTFKNLKPRTPVTLRAVIHPKLDDAVYIKTVYSPAQVYLNGELVFTFGKRENYPDYMVDPATELHIVETFGSGEPAELEIVYFSPRSRSSMTIHPPMVGTPKELIMERSRVLGIPLVFSLVQIVGGILLILISTCITIIDKKGMLFLWLGLFSLLTGLWSFGENNFASIIFRGSATLYIISFIGFFTFIIPLIHFIRSSVDFTDPRPTRFMELFYGVSASAALFLQLAGVVSCSQSMYYFHFCLPSALLLLMFFTIREFVRYKNIGAGRLILPITVLTLTAFLELFNYQTPITYVFSSLFQIGILLFLVIVGVTAGLSVKDSVALKNAEKELSFQQGLMAIQIKEQQERGLLLEQKEQLLRQQRHDLRHQLTAIQGLVPSGNKELQDYLNTLMEQIPRAEKAFCENRSVNAVITHYVSLCKTKNIELTMNLVVPPSGSTLSDSELCIIFGNLFENAVEACDRMTEGHRFIRLNSSLQYDLLTITLDNSFNGIVSTENGRFRSAKRDDFGIGLASVQSVAEKAGGDVEFRAEGNVFLSSVYVRV